MLSKNAISHFKLMSSNDVPSPGMTSRYSVPFIVLLFLFGVVTTGTAQEEFKGKMYKPMPLPEYSVPKLPDFKSNKPVIYNSKSKEINYLQEPDLSVLNADAAFEPGSNLAGDGKGMEELPGGQKRFSDLTLVNNTAGFPARRNVKVFFTGTDGGNYVCSGALVSPVHVITAGHCIYNHDSNPALAGWVSDVTVVPAYKREEKPFGEAQSVNLTSWTSWTQNRDYDWDIGLITLDFPIGGAVGWFGYAYNTDNNFVLNTTFHNYNYPAESPYNGRDMYYWFGTFDRVGGDEEGILYQNRVGYGGQSGSGTYYIDNDSRYVYGVHSHTLGSQENGHTRVNETVSDLIRRKRNEDPPLATDLVPFQVDVTNRSVQAGESVGDFLLEVFNFSQNNFRGETTVEVFLSTNDIISNLDTKIKTYNYTGLNINANGFQNLINSATNPIVIPANTSPNDYYIGVRMITNGDDQNNYSREWYLDQITVTAPTPELSVSRSSIDVGAASGTASFDVSSNISWTVSENASWLSVSPTSGSNDRTINIIYGANTSTSSRSATITVSGTGVSNRTVRVTQAGASAQLSISPSSANVSDNSGAVSFNVNSNTTWSISSDRNWATAAPTGGSGDGVVTVFYSSNSSTNNRVATISVNSGTITRNFTLTQDAMVIPPSLVITPAVRNVGYVAGCTTFAVNSNVNWQVSSSASWLTISPSGGSNNGVFDVCFEENPATSPRSASVVVTGGGLSRTLTINQDGKFIPPALSVSPTDRQVSASPGCVDFNVSGNVNWQVSHSAPWITNVNPTSGFDDGSFEVCYAENSSPDTRTAILTISGSGLTRTVSITQNGEPAGSSSPWEVTPTGNNHTVIVISDLTSSVNGSALEQDDWIGFFYEDAGVLKCAGAGQWSPTSNSSIAVYGDDSNTPAKDGFDIRETFIVKVWKDQEAKEYEVTAGFQPTGGFVTHTDEFAINGISVLNSLGSSGSGNSPWEYTNTGINHTVIITMAMNTDINGGNLTADDWIGFFYEDGGVLKCAGAGQWTSGNNGSITIYGDDANTPAKDGFTINETFKIKVWQAATSSEVEVNASYAPVGGVISHTDQFAVNGISQLMSLGSQPDQMTLTINLSEGWNTISSYVVPEVLDINSIIAPISNQVEIIKDGQGNAAIPAFNINNIGNWNISEGYQVKVSSNTSLTIEGDPVAEDTPISIAQGWQIIPVYNRTPQNAQTAFSSINNIIEIVKDNSGNSYIPSFGINGIGDLQPTQGYYLKASAVGTLNLQAAPNQGRKSFNNSIKTSQHYSAPVITGRSATIVLPYKLATEYLNVGDELVVKNKAGKIFGWSRFDGENTAITVWGDDTSTELIDGFYEGEKMDLYIRKLSGQQELGIRPFTASTKSLTFKTNDLLVIDQLDVDAPVEEFIQIVPNPVNGVATVNLSILDTQQVTIRIIDVNGRIMNSYRQQVDNNLNQLRLDTSLLPAGMYSYEVMGENGKVMRSLFVVQ